MSIEECFEQARKEIIVDMITDLSDSTLMILQSAVKSRSAFARDIYKTYCKLSTSNYEKPFSYVYFNSNLSYLQSLGLIALISTKVGRAYAHRVMLTFEKHVLEPIYNLRFEHLHPVWS
jgi:Cdc6-like AAA superfamily ATPase